MPWKPGKSTQDSKAADTALSAVSDAQQGGTQAEQPSQGARGLSLYLGFGRPSTSSAHHAPKRTGSTASMKTPSQQAAAGAGTAAVPSNAQRGGRNGASSITFDRLRREEVRASFALESSLRPEEDVVGLETMLKRHQQAPHLSYGAFVSMPPPKVAGPLSVSNADSRRRLVGFCSASAAPALIPQSKYGHSRSELSRVVCLHSVCVDKVYWGRGIGTQLLSSFIERLERAEAGQGPNGDAGRHGYEVVALLSRKSLVGFFEAAGFHVHTISYIREGSRDEWREMRRSICDKPRRADLDVGELLLPLSERESMDYATQPPLQDHEATITPATQQTATADRKLPAQLAIDPNGESHTWGVGDMVTSPVDDESGMQQKMLATLLASNNLSAGAARDLGLPEPARASPSDAAPRRYGKVLTAIYGQAVSAKTPAEDSFEALQARIVDRQTKMNLVRLFCPIETCGCGILGSQTATWGIYELGPLSDAALQASMRCPDLSGVAKEFEPPRSTSSWLDPLLQHFAGDSAKSIGPVRGFWVLPDPMRFDNVSFSRDVTWEVPKPSPMSLNRSRTGSSNNDISPAQSRGSDANRKRGTRMGSLSFAKENRHPDMADAEPPEPAIPTYSLGLTPGEKRPVKFIMCPDCDAGPIGFMLPRTTSVDSDGRPDYQGQQCFVAAHRVRYDM